MATIHIDIETIPSQNHEVIQAFKDNVKPPATYSKAESIAKWLEDNRDIEADKAHRKTSFDGALGEIISIAWALDNNDVQVVHRGTYPDEKDLLLAFFDVLVSSRDKYGNPVIISTWAGHYISGFDLRYIWQRCVLNNVRPTIAIPYDAKPWDSKIFDTKVAWTGTGQYSGVGSLDALSKAFGLEGKGDIDGSKVYDHWLAGKIEEIAEYNRQDVEKCRALYNKMNFIN